MKCAFVVDEFLKTVRDGLDCLTLEDDSLSIVTPFVTVDGDCIEVAICESPDGSTMTITDLGESTRYLASYDIDYKESSVRSDFLTQIQGTLDVSFINGRLTVTVPSSEVGDGMLRIVEACRFVSDLVYTGRPREENEFREEVHTYLRSIAKVSTGADARLIGRSMKSYTADFYASNDVGAWIEVITGVRKGSFDNKVRSAFVMFADTLDSVKKLTIIDDSSNFADPSDFALLGSVSYVAKWTDPDDIREKISRLTYLSK